ncbi:YbaB/EbfC family nucleoid-associated protein [Nocardia brasiliensis]
MDQWQRESLCSVNHDLRNQVGRIMDALEQQRAQAAEVRKQLAELRITATSTDLLVAVTVDADGTIIDLDITAEGMRNPPDVLQRSITEAARSAAAQAKERSAALIDPISSTATALSELVPDALDIQDNYGRRDT